jgi:ABC-type antimicrobial peptide transport system permease subunit
MPGIAELALGAAPIAGGALLGMAAGNFKGPDLRGAIKADMELLALLPPEQVERRAELQRVIDLRIDDIVESVDRNREIRHLATSYSGNWRDVVVFVCAVLFTIVWWNVSHSRSNWLVMFIVLIILSIVAAIYAARGIFRGLAHWRHSRGDTPQ